MNRKLLRWPVLFVLWAISLPALAQLRLAEVWQSHMVIQRDQPILVWGWAEPGVTVRSQLGNQQRQTTVKQDSSWSIIFTARQASATPDSVMVATEKQRVVLTDVLFGDVWLCAGQSNMAFPLASDQFARQTLAEAANARLRLYNRLPALTTYNQSYHPADIRHLSPNKFYTPTTWQRADSASARLFSAVGFYAGRRIQEELGIPIGLIHVAVGGSPTEAWLRPDEKVVDPILRSIWAGDWWMNPALEPWCIQRGHENLDALLLAGYPVPRDSLGPNHPFKPGFLFQAAIEPLLRLGIKGILWYQGESNALSLARARQHEHLFPELVVGWRTDWQRPDLPVYVCQLSSISTRKGYKSENWPYFRDSQRRLAERTPLVGMAVTSDLGHPTDVHPTNKKTVGERLAREMVAKTYARPYLTAPTVGQVVRKKNGWLLELNQAGTGLKTSDGQAVRGFALGDESSPQTDVSAIVHQNKIRLTALRKRSGTYLYYGWQPFTTANVVNSENLPLSTFRIPLP